MAINDDNETVAEMEKIKPIQSDKDFISFVYQIDKIKRDLSELGMEGEIQNQTVLSQLEKKLPYMVKRDWIKKVNEEFEDKTPKEIFEEFLKFLKLTKKQVEYDNAETRSGNTQGKAKTMKSFTMGEVEVKREPNVRKEPKREADIFPCIACNDGKTNLESCLHKMSECSVFQAMPVKDLLARVSCKKCPYSTNDHLFANCNKKVHCRKCDGSDHHGLLCDKKTHRSMNNVSMVKSSFTIHEDHVKQVKNPLPPVLCQVMFVKAKSNEDGRLLNLGAVFDSYATDNYITFKRAQELGLDGHDITLNVEGFNKNITRLDTKLYSVQVKDISGALHEYDCYGVEEITTPEDLPDKAGYNALWASK